MQLEKLIESLTYRPDFLQKIDLSRFGVDKSNFYIYKDYLNHPELSGNKIRKLYGYLLEIQKKKIDTIITLGGNRSNYMHACAFLPEMISVHLIAIIKGYEPKEYGYTLQILKEKNVEILFKTKQEIKENLVEIVAHLQSIYPHSMYIPEGGSGEYAHLGFRSLIEGRFDRFDRICIGVGTSATYHSIDRYKSPKTDLIGYAGVLDYSLQGNMVFDYTFGGFAKMTEELKQFVDDFEIETGILLDPIYTSKMVYGIISDYKSGKFSSEESIVAIHTGGLQGRNK